MTEDMKYLRERLNTANKNLLNLAAIAKGVGDVDEQRRLESKAEGIRLALDYIRVYQATSEKDNDNGST